MVELEKTMRCVMKLSATSAGNGVYETGQQAETQCPEEEYEKLA